MTTLASSLVFQTALDLGLAVSLHSRGVQLLTAVGRTTPKGKATDLLAHATLGSETLQVEALSPDGEAFLALVQ